MFQKEKCAVAALAAMILLSFETLASAVDPHVWVANHQGASLAKIRKSDNSVQATIPLPGGLPFGVAVDEESVWVTPYIGNFVSRVDKQSETENRIHLDANAFAVAVDPDFAWVTTGAMSSPARLMRVSRVGGAQDASIALPSPAAWGVAADAGAAWVAADGGILRVDKASGAVSVLTSVVSPRGIAADHDRVWVANYQQRNVLSIDKASGSILLSLDTAAYGGPHGIAVDESHAWVATYDPGWILKIDKSTGAVEAAIPVSGPHLHGVALDDESAWTDAYFDDIAFRIDKSAAEIVARTAVGPTPATFGDSTGAAYDYLFPSAPASSWFSSFDAKLDIRLAASSTDSYHLKAIFTLGIDSDGLAPLQETVAVGVGGVVVELPAGALFERHGTFRQAGMAGDRMLQLKIMPLGPGEYQMQLDVAGVELGSPMQVWPVSITIGNDSGVAQVEADVHLE